MVYLNLKKVSLPLDIFCTSMYKGHFCNNNKRFFGHFPSLATILKKMPFLHSEAKIWIWLFLIKSGKHITHMPNPPFWGDGGVKKWSPFLDLCASSPIFGPWKWALLAFSGARKWVRVIIVISILNFQSHSVFTRYHHSPGHIRQVIVRLLVHSVITTTTSSESEFVFFNLVFFLSLWHQRISDTSLRSQDIATQIFVTRRRRNCVFKVVQCVNKEKRAKMNQPNPPMWGHQKVKGNFHRFKEAVLPFTAEIHLETFALACYVATNLFHLWVGFVGTQEQLSRAAGHQIELSKYVWGEEHCWCRIIRELEIFTSWWISLTWITICVNVVCNQRKLICDIEESVIVKYERETRTTLKLLKQLEYNCNMLLTFQDKNFFFATFGQG